MVLARRFCHKVLELLMEEFKSGAVPHYFVMKTMGDIAGANPLDVIPQLRSILARSIPALGAIKHDNIRWVFSSAMSKFAEAIISHVHNFEDPQERKDEMYSFSSEMSSAYEFMFANWSKSSHKKVRLATMQALGHMSSIMRIESYNIQVPRIVPALLEMYRKETEADFLPITQSICSVLTVGCEDNNSVLAPFLNQLMADLHILACRPINYNEPASIKNHNELLRCFEVLGRRYTDELINFLLRQMENKKPGDTHIKDGTINIIKHLVTRLDDALAFKKELIVSGLQPLVQNETSYLVRKSLSQLVITLASKEYLHMEGGEVLLEFIVRNCSISDEEIEKYNREAKPNANAVTPGELRSVCDHVLNLMTTTIPSSHQILWPYILEPLVNLKYSAATGTLCKCAAFVGNIKREQFIEEYLIDFDKMVNLPKPQVILARLLVLLSLPIRSNNIGSPILDCLLQISGIIHPSIIDRWDTTIPKIVNYMSENLDNWNQTTWEDLVMRLLTETIRVISDDEWTMKLGDAFVDHFRMYKSDNDLKRVCYKLLGVVLGSITHKDFIRNRLAALWEDANHEDEKHRLGCAQAFGYTAASHLDIVLEKLAIVSKGPEKKKEESGGFFSKLFSPKEEGVRAGPSSSTLALAYGYVTSYARPQIITSRLDGQIMANIKPLLNSRNATLRETLLKAIELIGKSVHPLRLNMKYELKMRDELIDAIITYLTPVKKGPPITNTIREAALSTTAVLIGLEPTIKQETEGKLLTITTEFFTLPEDDKSEMILDNFNKMLSTIIQRDTTILRLRSLFDKINPYISSNVEVERVRGTTTLLYLLKKFIEYVMESEDKNDSCFDNIGAVLSFVLPRATDPNQKIRQMALEATQLILYIDFLLRARVEKKDTSPPQSLTPLTTLRKQIVTADLMDQMSVVMELTSTLAEFISIGELGSLLSGLVKELNDSQGNSSRGTCVVIYGLVSHRATDLDTDVNSLVDEICDQLTSIDNDSTINGTLNALKQLAMTHTTMVMDKILDRPLPHPDFLQKAIQLLARDRKLSQKVFYHLMNTLNNTELFETIIVDRQKKTTKVEPTHRSLSATASLNEIFNKPDVKDFVTELYPRIFPTLLLRLGSSRGFDHAIETAVNTFKAFLECTEDLPLLAILDADSAWDTLKGDKYLEVIPIITGHICRTRPNLMQSIYSFLVPYLKGVYQGQRLITVTALGEFINHCGDDDDLLAKVIDSILNSMSSKDLKIQALEGLSNIVSTKQEQQDTYATTILDALMSGLEDSDEDISLAALTGLKKVMSTVDDRRVAPIIITLFRRLSPLLDKPVATIRAASAELIGTLSRFGDGTAKNQFTENCHKILPTILFHIADTDTDVQVACKHTMVAISPYLRDDEIHKLFTGSNFNPNRPLNYDDFIAYVSRLLIKAFPDRLNYYIMESVDTYFKSQWDVIKAAAANFVGNVLGSIPSEQRDAMNLNPGRVSKALISLMAQPSGMVRKKAATAMALLHTY